MINKWIKYETRSTKFLSVGTFREGIGAREGVEVRASCKYNAT